MFLRKELRNQVSPRGGERQIETRQQALLSQMASSSTTAPITPRTSLGSAGEEKKNQNGPFVILKETKWLRCAAEATLRTDVA